MLAMLVLPGMSPLWIALTAVLMLISLVPVLGYMSWMMA